MCLRVWSWCAVFAGAMVPDSLVKFSQIEIGVDRIEVLVNVLYK